MCPNCKLSKCPECFAAEQKRLREKDELSKQIGRQSSPEAFEADENINVYFAFRSTSILSRDTGGGTRVIRKPILEDSPLNGDD